MEWTAIGLGEGRAAPVALGLPAEAFYFKRVALPRGEGRAAGDARGYAAGAIDPDLPVAIEDCLLYCRRYSGGLSAFAVEKRRYAEMADGFTAARGAASDCLVPVPLVVWDRACGDILRRDPGFSGLLFHLDARGERWTLLAGTVRRGDTALAALATMAGGDAGAVRRSAGIIASRLRAGDGARGAVACSFSGKEGGVAATALAESCGAAAPAAPIDGIGGGDGTALRYSLSDYLWRDCPAVETESAALKRIRGRRSLLPAMIAAAGAAVLLASSIHLDLAARRSLRATDAQIGAAAARLAGMPLRQRGPAALAPARSAFAERFPQEVRDMAIPPPRDIVGTVFAFAVARGMDISSIEYDGAAITFSLMAEGDGDVGALSEELMRSGFAVETAKAAPAADGAASGWTLTAMQGVAR